MSDPDLALLLEAAASAHRLRDAHGSLLPDPAWLDLPPQDRASAFAHQRAARLLESVLDPAGLSTTAHAVLARAATLPQLHP
jgi:hypothetical protein